MADNETIASIIAEKRRLAEQIRNNLSTVLVRQWHQQAEIKSLEDEANRLETALKRERAAYEQTIGKLREALESCLGFIMRLDRAFNPYMQNLLEDATAKAEAALATTSIKNTQAEV